MEGRGWKSGGSKKKIRKKKDTEEMKKLHWISTYNKGYNGFDGVVATERQLSCASFAGVGTLLPRQHFIL